MLQCFLVFSHGKNIRQVVLFHEALSKLRVSGSIIGSCRQLLLGSIVGFCWDRPSALAVGFCWDQPQAAR
jgi:hypothetical protein